MKKSILLFAATLFAAATFAQTPTVSASSVTFKYCETTDTAFSLIKKVPYDWVTPNQTITITEYGTQVYTIDNARGCDSIVAITLNSPFLPGKFSVSEDNQKVQFARGNLQFRSTQNGVAGDLMHSVAEGGSMQGEWRIAANQWDIISTDVNAENHTATSTGWFDQFIHCGSGYYQVHPWNLDCSITGNISKTNRDWGWFNEISNGGTYHTCYTLTWPQWEYILTGRTNAADLRGKATVHNQEGVILLPDDWHLPSGCSWNPNATDYTTNEYNTDEVWNKMENAGAVFFPFVSNQQEGQGSGYWAPYDGGGYFWFCQSLSENVIKGWSNYTDRKLVRVVCDAQ